MQVQLDIDEGEPEPQFFSGLRMCQLLRIEYLRGLARTGHQLACKVADFDACCARTLHVFFG